MKKHIQCRQKEGFQSDKCPEPDILTEEPASVHSEKQPVDKEDKTNCGEGFSAILDNLGKKAQKLIDERKFKEAEIVLNDFIYHCADLSKEQLKNESVDEIHAAMGYVMYQLKDYNQAKRHFQEALAINVENEVANQFMKDILIKAVKQKKLQ